MKKGLFVFFVYFFLVPAAEAYQYSYVPKSSAPIIYNFTYRKREKCSIGKLYPYPQQVGVCASCKDEAEYLIDSTTKKAGCFKCPEGTLLVRRNGYPMCLSDYPVVNGKASKPNGEPVSREELKRIASGLNADYRISLAPDTHEKSYNNKERLPNVCEMLYPEDEDAKRQVMTCQRLGQKNDFLCPYVEKDSEEKWTCKACTKDTPYKKADGGCFNCPYGEETVSLPNGETVCASEAPPPPKKKPTARPKKKATPKKTPQKRK